MDSEVGPGMRSESLAKLLNDYLPADEREAEHKAQMLALLDGEHDPFSRHSFSPGHFTASSFVLSPDRSSLLLIFHRKLRRWLQPGGHVEPGDSSMGAAALRELGEETGLSGPSLDEAAESLLDLDVHPIPARPDEPGHQHFDVRFLVQAAGDELQAASDASAARWIPLSEVSALESDASVMRAVRKLRLGSALCALFSLFCFGCGDGGNGAQPHTSPLTPATGNSSGYFRLRLDVDQLGVTAPEVSGVEVGALRAVDLEVLDSGQLQMMVQGSRVADAVDVSVSVGDVERRLPGAFEYLPPRAPIFERMVAFGASLTQGVQRGVPGFEGAVMSPAAQLARQLGGYFPIPLITKGLFPGLGPADVGPAPGCEVPDVVDIMETQLPQILPALVDPQSGEIDFALSRVNPGLEVHNLAVGGLKLRHLIDGTEMTDIGRNFVSHLVYQPRGGLFDPIEQTVLERIEALEPSLIVSMDFLGNDLIAALVEAETIDLALSTPVAEIEGQLDRILDRLLAIGVPVFLANAPRVTLMPVAAAKARAMSQGQRTTREEAEALLSSIDELAHAYNRVLELRAPAPGLHIVDVYEFVETIAEEGLEVGAEVLRVQRFGGLLGLDGVHFTQTGYAVLANLFIDAINDALGTTVSRVDLAAVLAQDPESPAALREKGLEIASCSP